MLPCGAIWLGATVIPIGPIVLVHVDRTGIQSVGVVEFGTDGNPISVGGHGVSGSEFDAGFRGIQCGFERPGPVGLTAEDFDVLFQISRQENISANGHG